MQEWIEVNLKCKHLTDNKHKDQVWFTRADVIKILKKFKEGNYGNNGQVPKDTPVS